MPKRKTLVADTDGSTCFSQLIWKGGTVYAQFTDGTHELYDMSKAEAVDWFADDSLGGYFNKMVR
jgi:hypothetical protein